MPSSTDRHEARRRAVGVRPQRAVMHRAVMTDRDRLLGLLAEYGIVPSRAKHLPDTDLGDSCVVLSEDAGGVLGYEDNFCAFRFGPSGQFVSFEVHGHQPRLPGAV